MRGKFITIEGQDGAGKSTNSALVANYLIKAGIELVQTREPGGTKFAETIRSLLLEPSDHDFGGLAELLLVFAARADHIEKVIEPALSAGKWVLCDRFTDASFAYQGGGRGIEINQIKTLQSLVQNSLQPDLTLLLDLPVEVGETRAGQRSAADRFERQKIAFKQRVRDVYLSIAHTEPDRVVIIDANQELNNVTAQIIDQLNNLLTNTNSE